MERPIDIGKSLINEGKLLAAKSPKPGGVPFPKEAAKSDEKEPGTDGEEVRKSVPSCITVAAATHNKIVDEEADEEEFNDEASHASSHRPVQEGPDIYAGGAVRGHSCDLCNELFSSNDFMLSHRKTHTIKASDLRYKCQTCPFSTDKKFILDRHRRQHSGLKPFTCPDCKRNFATKSTLKAHLVTHSEERPFACDECEKTFKLLSRLTSHKKEVHSGVRDYRCKVCGLDFGRKQLLTKHIKAHPKCSLCEFRGKDIFKLKEHYKKGVHSQTEM